MHLLRLAWDHPGSLTLHTVVKVYCISSGSSSRTMAPCEKCFYMQLVKGREEMEVSHRSNPPQRRDVDDLFLCV